MKKPMAVFLFMSSLFVLNARSSAQEDFLIEVRLFKAGSDTAAPPSDVIVSSFADSFLVYEHPAKIRSDFARISDMQAELNSLYQFQSVNHLTTSRILWDGKKRRVGETISLGNDSYPIYLYPKITSRTDLKLRVEIFKHIGKVRGDQDASLPRPNEKQIPIGRVLMHSASDQERLLDSEISLTFDWPVILGFPVNGHAYFLSLSVGRRPSSPGRERIVPSESRAAGIDNIPRPIRMVTPAYPAACRERRIEGTVILNISIAASGEVSQVRTLISPDADLEQSAYQALRQWTFEPVMKRGKPIPVVFAVAVDYRLRGRPPALSPRSQSEPVPSEIEIILARCARYCEALRLSVLDFVCLESIEEKITSSTQATVLGYPRPSGGTQPGMLRRYTVLNPRRTVTNRYVYDYQLVRKSGNVTENRHLISENGRPVDQKNAPLKTQCFWHSNVIFGPLGILSAEAQEQHGYKLLGEEKLQGEKAYVIEAAPKNTESAEHLYGKVWVRKSDYSIMKIEWEQSSLQNYGIIEEIAENLRAKPRIRLVSEYGIEKNGIRFPSRYAIKETYLSKRTGKRFQRTETIIVYDNYRFFSVETKVKYQGEEG